MGNPYLKPTGRRSIFSGEEMRHDTKEIKFFPLSLGLLQNSLPHNRSNFPINQY